MDQIRLSDGSIPPPGSIYRNWKFGPNGEILQAGTIETPETRKNEQVLQALARIEERLSKIEEHLGIG